VCLTEILTATPPAPVAPNARATPLPDADFAFVRYFSYDKNPRGIPNTDALRAWNTDIAALAAAGIRQVILQDWDADWRYGDGDAWNATLLRAMAASAHANGVNAWLYTIPSCPEKNSRAYASARPLLPRPPCGDYPVSEGNLPARRWESADLSRAYLDAFDAHHAPWLDPSETGANDAFDGLYVDYATDANGNNARALNDWFARHASDGRFNLVGNLGVSPLTPPFDNHASLASWRLALVENCQAVKGPDLNAACLALERRAAWPAHATAFGPATTTLVNSARQAGMGVTLYFENRLSESPADALGALALAGATRG
jgi:hypothetical protein